VYHLHPSIKNDLDIIVFFLLLLSVYNQCYDKKYHLIYSHDQITVFFLFFIYIPLVNVWRSVESMILIRLFPNVSSTEWWRKVRVFGIPEKHWRSVWKIYQARTLFSLRKKKMLDRACQLHVSHLLWLLRKNKNKGNVHRTQRLQGFLS
jgi:hypothetical protein